MISKAEAARALGVPSCVFEDLRLHDSNPVVGIDTYIAQLKEPVRGFGKRGDHVLFPIAYKVELKADK